MNRDAPDSALLTIFAEEALTQLTLVDAGLVTLAQDGAAAPARLLASMMLALHTLAGAARAVDRLLTRQPDGRTRNRALALIAQLDAMARQWHLACHA